MAKPSAFARGFTSLQKKRPRIIRGLLLVWLASVGVALVPVALLGERLERVLRRRRGKGPLEGVGPFVPRVVRGHVARAHQDDGQQNDKEHEGREGDEGADRRDVVPVGEGLRIVDVAARHALTAEEVLREEGQVRTEEHGPEVQLACPLGEHTARHLGHVEVDAREDAEHGAEAHHIVEVRHDIVGVVIDAVHPCLAQHDAGDATDGEEEQEAKPAPKSTAKPAATNKKGEDKRLKLSNNLEGGRQDLLSTLILTTEHPLKKLDSSKIRFTDKDFKAITGFTLNKDSTGKQLIIQHSWTENTTYNLILEKDFAMDTMDNKFMKTDTIGFTSKKESDYGSIDIKIANIDSNLHPILLLMKDSKIFLQQQAKQEKYKIKLFNPGEYQISILFDINNNSKWDTGNYWKKLQPEKVVARKQTLQIRANWDNELRIDLKDIQ